MDSRACLWVHSGSCWPFSVPDHSSAPWSLVFSPCGCIHPSSPSSPAVAGGSVSGSSSGSSGPASQRGLIAQIASPIPHGKGTSVAWHQALLKQAPLFPASCGGDAVPRPTHA